MSRRTLEAFITICGATINTIPFVCVLIVLYGMLFGTKAPVGLILLVVGYAALTECIRSYVERVLPYLLAHVVPLVLFWFVVRMEPWDKLVGGFLLIVILLFALVQKIRRMGVSRAYHPALICCVLFATYLVPNTAYVVVLGEIYLALFLVELFFRQFVRYLERETMTNNQLDEGKLFVQSGSIAFGYGVLAFLTVILLCDEKVAQAIGEKVSYVFLRCIRFLLSLFSRKAGEPEGSQVIEQEQSLIQEMFKGVGTGGEPGLFWVILEKLALVIGGIVVAAIVIYCVGWVIRAFVQSFVPKDAREDLIEDLRPEDKRVNTAERGRFLAWKSLVRPVTSQEKIRRSYLLFLKRLRKEGNLQKGRTLSARETISDHVQDEKTGQHFATLYEKARYSNEPCHPEEAREAGKISRTLVTK